MLSTPKRSRTARSLTARSLTAGSLAVLLAGASLFGAVSTATAATAEYTTADGAAYTVPVSIEVGDAIHVSGTGWRSADGTAGSVVAVKLDAGAVSTTGVVTHPLTGAAQGNKTIIALVEADAAGSWQVDIPFPTLENSTAAWAAGETHSVQLLTGSLRAGDVVRSGVATFTVTAPPAPEAEIPHAGAATTTADGAVVYTPTQLAAGEPIHLSGSGWRKIAGDSGSIVAVRLDAATVSTKLDVVHPITGALQANRTIYAVVQARADGEWQLDIPFPTLENSSAAWGAGESHTITVLSGSLGVPAGSDAVRTATATVAIAGADPAGPPAWTHETVTVTDAASGSVATAWVQQQISTDAAATVRIKGTGWSDRAGAGASTVAIKLNSGPGTQYTRSGDGVVRHPSATGDDTIWTLLAPTDPEDHPNVIAIDPDGTFEVELDLPAGLAAGQYLTVQFQSGRFDAADIVRSVVTAPLVVGGVPYAEEGAGEQPTCVPTSAAPTIVIENPTVEAGGLLHVTGAGWCHPAENGGGSAIAFKIDEGAFSRLTTEVHANKTIWAIVQARDEDGTFDAFLRLPDGTTAGANGSAPAFGEGAHTLRLLTGSLIPGDAPRTLLSGEFVVGAYRPNGAPDPVDAATLNGAVRGGVSAELTASELVVTVPGAAAGDWAFLTPYAADGSPRYPWLATWFRVAADGTVRAPLDGATLPVGDIKIAVQSGEQGEFGTLLGWAPLTVAAPAPAPTPIPAPEPVAAPAAEAASQTRPAYSLSPRLAQSAAPTSVPQAPFADDSGLDASNTGGVRGTQDGAVVTIALDGAAPGDWVYVYAYSEPTPVGWIRVDETRLIRVDVSALPEGAHKLAVLDIEGALIGWTSATVAAAERSEAVAAEQDAASSSLQDEKATDAAAVLAAEPAASAGLSAADWWLLAGGALIAAGIVVALVVVQRRRASETAEKP